MIAARRRLCGAKQPPYRTRWTHGSDISAASFSKSSNDDSVIPVMLSDYGFVNAYTRSP